jgi:hypothetical protein
MDWKAANPLVTEEGDSRGVKLPFAEHGSTGAPARWQSTRSSDPSKTDE